VAIVFALNDFALGVAIGIVFSAAFIQKEL
jgi:hypothetical protein